MREKNKEETNLICDNTRIIYVNFSFSQFVFGLPPPESVRQSSEDMSM